MNKQEATQTYLAHAIDFLHDHFDYSLFEQEMIEAAEDDEEVREVLSHLDKVARADFRFSVRAYTEDGIESTGW